MIQQHFPFYAGPTREDLAHIPAVLKAHRQWILFRLEEVVNPKTGEVKLNKIPINPQTLRNASTTNPHTWGTFEQCVTALPVALEGWAEITNTVFRGGGLGFVLTADDPYVLVDLDHSVEPGTGIIVDWARTIVDTLNTYTQRSVSQQGLHAIVCGKVPPGGNQHGNLQMWDHDRFCAMTGRHLAGTLLTIEQRQSQLTMVHSAFILRPKAEAVVTKQQEQHVTHIPASGFLQLSDEAILAKARQAQNHDKFLRLWSGDWSSYGSQSEADEALCCLLAFWTRDTGQIDRLFCESGLYRKEKWHDREDYRARTIAYAVEHTTSYTPEKAFSVPHSTPTPANQIKRKVPVLAPSTFDESPPPFWQTWTLLSPEQKRDLILDHPVVEDWINDHALPILAHFRSNARAWARIKARYKRIGGNPWDLEKACDDLVLLTPSLNGTGALVALDPALSPEQRLQTLLASPTPDLWYGNLDVLAAVRGAPAQWGLVKARAQRLHLSPYDLQLAVDDYLKTHKPVLTRTPTTNTLAGESLAVSLSTLEEEWGIPLETCIRHGTDNATWHLRQPDGKEIGLGPTKALLNEQLVRVAIFDATGKMIRAYGKKDQERWRELMEIIAAIAITVDTPEITALGQARVLLSGYLENQECALDSSSEGWEILALENRPFIRENLLHVHALHIWSAYGRIMMPDLKHRDILDCLRLLGGYRVTVALYEPTRTSRSVWALPVTCLDTENVSLV